MASPASRHAVLTGAPGAGKTTLLDAAAASGLHTSPEVARNLLRQPGGMALRECDPLGFAEAMARAHVDEFEKSRELAGVTVFDRALPDVVGFLEVSGLPVSAEIDWLCQSLRYTGPILRAPAWQDIYQQDSERIQNWEEAAASDAAVTTAWRGYGYEVIDLPLVSVAERLVFLRSAMGL